MPLGPERTVSISSDVVKERGVGQTTQATTAAIRTSATEPAMSRALADHQAGQTGAAAALREAADEYVKLLTDHISKEDHVLYPIADEKIAAPVQAAMVEAFEKIEEERIGVGTHERYHEMLKEFRRGYLTKK